MFRARDLLQKEEFFITIITLSSLQLQFRKAQLLYQDSTTLTKSQYPHNYYV